MQSDNRNRNAVLVAAAVIASPRLYDLKDTPALRAVIADAIRVAEYMERVIQRRNGVLRIAQHSKSVE